MFRTLRNTGLLERLINEGIEYIFVSNIDNLGATLDLRIVKFLLESQQDYVMEMTPKTDADKKVLFFPL